MRYTSRQAYAGILALAGFLLVLTGCKGQFDGAYADDATILSANEQYTTTTFLGKQVAPNQYVFRMESFSGVRTVWRYTTKAGREFTLHAELTETAGGDLKLVLVTPDEEVVELCTASGGSARAVYEFTTLPGEYRIKVVGRGMPEGGADIVMEGVTGAFG